MALQAGIRNDSWIRGSFLISNAGRSPIDKRARLDSGARIKFSDTTLGGARCINPPYQFTQYADMTVPGLNTAFSYSMDNPVYREIIESNDQLTDERNSAVAATGLGRVYSDMYDDTGEYITMRMGVPRYNSLLSFFFSFYNPEAAAVARTGAGSSLFYQAASIVGSVVGFAIAPVMFIGKGIQFLLGKSVSRYYYLEPAMHNYWMAANNIANTIAVNQGIVPRVGGRDESPEEAQARRDEILAYHEMLPDIFRRDGGIDLFGVANRYNRLSLKFQEAVNDLAIEATSMGGFMDALRDWANNTAFGAITDTNVRDIQTYVTEYLNATGNQFENVSSEQLERAMLAFTPENPNPSADQATDSASDTPRLARWSFLDKLGDHYEAGLNDGAEFITFRVDSTGPTQESFSNSVGQSSIAQSFNSMSSAARSVKFNAGQFQSGIGLVDSVMGAVQDVVAGGLDAIGLSNLTALMGNAFVDIPKVWQDSAATLPAPSYTIELRSWSGDPISRFKNIWVPVSMLLATVLPISTGKQSYFSPFILEAYSRSRITCKLGMVRDLSITRGVGNLGRNMEGDPLGVTIQFSIVDLSEIVHMPISTDSGFWSGLAQLGGKALDTATGLVVGEHNYYQSAATLLDPTLWDDSNKFSEYMAVLGGLTLQEQIYKSKKIRLAQTRLMTSFDTWLSAPSFMSAVSGSTSGRILSLFGRGTVSEN